MVHCKNCTETQMEKIKGSLGDEKYDFIFLKRQGSNQFPEEQLALVKVSIILNFNFENVRSAQ